MLEQRSLREVTTMCSVTMASDSSHPATRKLTEQVVLPAVLAFFPVVLVVVTLGPSWSTTGDSAAIVQRSVEILDGRFPLVGQASTASAAASHLGPVEFYLMAIPSAVSVSWGVVLASTVLTALFVFSVILSARNDDQDMAPWILAIGFAVLFWSVAGVVMFDPWNPYFGLVPFASYLAFVALALDARRFAMTGALVAGSVAAQAHLAYVVPVAGVAGAALLVGLGRRRTGGGSFSEIWRLRSSPREVWLRVVAVGLIWLPPLLNEVKGPSNLSALASAGGGGTQEGIGAKGSLWVVTNALWVGDLTSHSPLSSATLLQEGSVLRYLFAAAVVAALVVIAVRCRGELVGHASVVLSAALVSGYIALVRMPRGSILSAQNYLFLWPVVIGCYLLVIAVGARFALERLPEINRRLGSRSTLLAAALVAVFVAVTFLIPNRSPVDSHVVEPSRLFHQMVSETGSESVTLDFGNSLETFAVGAGLATSLRHDGVEVAVTGLGATQFTNSKPDGACVPGDPVFRVVRGSDAIGSEQAVSTFVPSEGVRAERERVAAPIEAKIEQSKGITTDDGSVIDAEEALGLLRQGRLTALLELADIREPEFTRSELADLRASERKAWETFVLERLPTDC